MKLLAVVLVACLAFWFIGLRIADRRSDGNGVAQATKDNINSVAQVLRQATANAQQAGSSKTWQGKVNARCSRDSAALSRLGTPRSLDEIAAYLGRALPIVRRQHERVIAGLPADEASAAKPRSPSVREAGGHPRPRPWQRPAEATRARCSPQSTTSARSRAWRTGTSSVWA